MASSLEILRPTPSHRTSPRATALSTTAHDLETRSIAISKALLTTTDPSTSPILKTHLTPDFVSEDINKNRAPRMNAEVISTSANVDEERGHASVWLLLRETDTRRGGLGGESVSILCWWREGGRWRCWRQSKMRGVSGFPQWYRM